MGFVGLLEDGEDSGVFFEGGPEGLGAGSVVVLGEAASEELGTEEDEGSLHYVVKTVVADVSVAPVFVHALHFGAIDLHLARHADELRKCGETRHTAGAVVGQHVGEVHVAFITESIPIVGPSAAARIVRRKLHPMFEHAIGQHWQIEPPPVEGDHGRVPLPNEVGELLEDLGFVGRRVLLATEGTEFQELVRMIEPQDPERDHLMKGCRRETTYGRIPDEVGIGHGFDVEDEKRSGHMLKLAEKCRKIFRVKTAVRFGSFT